MNIGEFKARVGDLYRPSLFQVNIGFPAGVAGESARQVQVMCKGAQIPEDTVNAVDVFYMGRAIKVAGNRTFNDITLTFYADAEFNLRGAFERWMALMNTHITNVGLTNHNLYKGDIIVTALDRAGKAGASYKIQGAFPTNISALDLDFSTTDSVGEFSITFAYDVWTNTKSVTL